MLVKACLRDLDLYLLSRCQMLTLGCGISRGLDVGILLLEAHFQMALVFGHSEKRACSDGHREL